MPKAIITLDEQQVARLEQIVLDRDIEDAWALLTEIRAKVRATQDTRCGIEKLRKGNKIF
jgi:hypothetical protein